MDLKEFGYMIEQERRILNKLAERYGLLNRRTLDKSKKIDILVSEYNRQRLQIEKKKRSKSNRCLEDETRS